MRTRTPSSPAAISGLPQPMGAADAARMRRAFEAQARGDFATAARESERLDDRRLMGHLLADRHRRGEPSLHEIQAWLGDFADLPDAPALHDALLRRLPSGATAPPPPSQPDLSAEILPEDRAPAEPPLSRDTGLERAVQARLNDGNLDAALGLIRARRGLSQAYLGQLKAEMAQSLFRQGRDADAWAIAQEGLRLAPQNAQAAYQAGLAAWGMQNYESAYTAFERAARNEQAAPTLRAAAAFWTARSAVRARRPAQYVPWMLQAAQEPRTFHGMIARRSLGLPPGLVWERDVANESRAQGLAETAGGWRALALLQIGQRERAEAELRLLQRRTRNNFQVTQGILAVAQQANMPGLAAQVATAAQLEDGRTRDGARYPLPVLLPNGGFRMDPSLLYALALQESRFDPSAISRAGARGLLQLMPATASYVANDPSLRAEGVERLHDPGFSLELGQRYVHYLARHEAVRGDLIRLLAAYNAGPGNLTRWLPAAQRRADPLLFIESIPVHETRSFVTRVLTFSWIYAHRLGLPTPSLDQIAGGGFPSFASVEEVTAMLRVTSARPN
ncbi:lytic transglycosylase domain-containing protein [Sediminicoccus sp. KRV36]|uniref:lytic transglycosylase domain-containing protein n=1 Tax=Sediminicoccus sp. KRV36 TaxID=3133721 RepID=UPI00200E1D06|nr:lytic transglycosylase domain-containing protein [Sediminicoccus rosea]UPY39051.1 lytic transglycosylase domain-containing protein [Sediminicoccus rosea]